MLGSSIGYDSAPSLAEAPRVKHTCGTSLLLFRDKGCGVPLPSRVHRTHQRHHEYDKQVIVIDQFRPSQSTYYVQP